MVTLTKLPGAPARARPTPGAPEPKPENAHDRCPECGGTLARDPQHAEILCQSCGLVVAEKEIDYGPDWRAFDAASNERRAHTGAPMTESLHDYGLSTTVGRGSRDAMGKAIPSSKRLQIARMRRLHQRTTFGSGAERNLARAITEIHRVASALDVPRAVAERGIRIYRRAAAESMIQGRSIEGIAAAALFAACRLAGVPRDPEHFTRASGVDKRTLLRLHRLLVREFKLQEPQPTAQDYIARFGSKLHITHVAEARARELVRRADEKGLTSGRSPAGVAAAVLYLGSRDVGEPRTQKEVAEAAGVTEVTVRNRARDLEPVLDAPMRVEPAAEPVHN